jgi:YD repeat-containing protein
VRGDLLTSYDGQTITADEIGNMLTDGTWTYTWEHGRELASMTDGSTTWNYTYDADGMRTKRTNGSMTYAYVYNGGQLSQMTVGSNTLYFAYDAFGTPMSVTYNGTAYYYVTNIQGDVIKIVNASGTTVVDYTYDTWGTLQSTTGSMASTLGAHNPLRYRGYVYDEDVTNQYPLIPL